MLVNMATQLYQKLLLVGILVILIIAIANARKSTDGHHEGCVSRNRSEPSFRAASLGNTTSMECSLECPKDSHYLWGHSYDDKGSMHVMEGGKAKRKILDVVVEVSGSGTGSFGYYCCSCGQKDQHSVIQDSCCYYVAVRPRILYFNVQESGSVTNTISSSGHAFISCKAEGVPVPKITIMGPDSIKLSSVEPTNSWNSSAVNISLGKVGPRTPGEYKCIAELNENIVDYKTLALTLKEYATAWDGPTILLVVVIVIVVFAVCVSVIYFCCNRTSKYMYSGDISDLKVEVKGSSVIEIDGRPRRRR